MAELEYNPDEIDGDEDGQERVSCKFIPNADLNKRTCSLIWVLPPAHMVAHVMMQEWLPSRDNVVFLIDAQAAMFEDAGLKDMPVGQA